MAEVAQTQAPRTTGSAILHHAAAYDLMMWLHNFGRESTFRANAIRLAALTRGESVLDVGCGTGTLAIAAKKAIGSAGAICAIDASIEMIARARAKAKRRHLDVAFEHGVAEALPFPDARFDVVLSTIMLHHLPKKVRLQAAREIRRVLKPGGRVLIVDFQDSGKRGGFIERFRRHRHGHVTIDDMLALLAEAGLNVTQSGPFRKPNLYFVIATHQDG